MVVDLFVWLVLVNDHELKAQKPTLYSPNIREKVLSLFVGVQQHCCDLGFHPHPAKASLLSSVIFRSFFPLFFPPPSFKSHQVRNLLQSPIIAPASL